MHGESVFTTVKRVDLQMFGDYVLTYASRVGFLFPPQNVQQLAKVQRICLDQRRACIRRVVVPSMCKRLVEIRKVHFKRAGCLYKSVSTTVKCL